MSINIAPATATASVISNKSFEAAYKGIYVFKPMEVFYQEVNPETQNANPRSCAHTLAEQVW